MPIRARLISSLLFVILLPIPGTALADSADVLEARSQCRRDPQVDTHSICRFAVRIRHKDDAWKHYTRHFQFVQPDGEVLVTNFLKQPHPEEIFTRTVKGIRVPREVEWLDVRAGDLEHESGEIFRVEIKHPPAKKAAGKEAKEATEPDAEE